MRQLGTLARAASALPPNLGLPGRAVERQFSTSLLCRSGSVPEEEQLPAHAQVSIRDLVCLDKNYLSCDARCYNCVTLQQSNPIHKL